MPNAYPNKIQVVRGGQTETLIDLTGDTVTAADVAQGKYFHLATGERVQGTSIDGDNLGYGVSTQPLVGTARVGATEI